MDYLHMDCMVEHMELFLYRFIDIDIYQLENFYNLLVAGWVGAGWVTAHGVVAGWVTAWVNWKKKIKIIYLDF